MKTKEEVFNIINSKHVIGNNYDIPMEAIYPASKLPDNNIGCFIIEGNHIWCGGFENGNFVRCTVTNGLVNKYVEKVNNPDWWIPYDSKTYTPNKRKKVITVKELINKLSSYPDDCEVIINDCKFKSFYYNADGEYLKIE